MLLIKKIKKTVNQIISSAYIENIVFVFLERHSCTVALVQMYQANYTVLDIFSSSGKDFKALYQANSLKEVFVEIATLVDQLESKHNIYGERVILISTFASYIEKNAVIHNEKINNSNKFIKNIYKNICNKQDILPYIPINVIPLEVNINGDELKEGLDLTQLKKYKGSELSMAAQVIAVDHNVVSTYVDIFNSMGLKLDGILHPSVCLYSITQGLQKGYGDHLVFYVSEDSIVYIDHDGRVRSMFIYHRGYDYIISELAHKLEIPVSIAYDIINSYEQYIVLDNIINEKEYIEVQGSAKTYKFTLDYLRSVYVEIHSEIVIDFFKTLDINAVEKSQCFMVVKKSRSIFNKFIVSALQKQTGINIKLYILENNNFTIEGFIRYYFNMYKHDFGIYSFKNN